MSVEGAGPRILIVDDDPVMRMLCRRILVEALPRGVAVDEAPTAEEAVVLLRQRAYAVVLSDHHMASMNGIDLLELALREQPECLRVLMTGRAQLELVQEALTRARIDGFIPKPPTLPEMRARLLALLAPSA
jgi:CheY-like chemotaxis protein